MIDRRFGTDELGDVFGSEVADALEMGRFLEGSIEASAMELPAVEMGFDAATEARGDFVDGVMAAIEDEPAPAPVGFLLPLRRRGFLRGLGASVRQAWVAVGGSGRPALGRVAALAYVLVVAIAGLSLTGAATIGAAGALGILGPSPTRIPAPTQPASTIAPQPTAPPSRQLPSTAPGPTLAPSPSPSPIESEDNGGAQATDDHGGNSGPGGGGADNSGPGSSSSGSGSGSSGSGSDDSGSGSGSDSSGPSATSSSGSGGSGSDSGSDSSGSGSGS